MNLESRFQIRLAVSSDWEAITDFNSRLASETEGKTLVAQTLGAGVRALLANPRHGRYLVACIGLRIIGQMMHTREWSDWRNGEIWWVQSVYVDPEFRRCGVFRDLFRAMEQLAEETSQVIGIRLYVEQDNLPAQKAYERLGLVHPGYTVMERFLGKSDSPQPEEQFS